MKNSPTGKGIEDQVEAAWLWLLDHPGVHEFWLSAGGRLKHGPREAGAIEVGPFDRRVSLGDFRESVYDAYSELKAAVHGVGHG